MALKVNYKAGDPFPPDDLNQITTTINDNVADVTTATTDVASTAASLNTTTAIVNTNQNTLVALQSQLAAGQVTQANLQTTLDSLNSRVTVLETVPPGPPAVPTAPTGVTIGTITTTSIVVSWTAPTGTAATSYTVRRSPTGTGAYTDAVTVSAPTVTATLTGLTPATGYDIAVVAKNAAGPGGQSAPLVNIRTASSFTPSPAWTQIPPATSIIMNDGGVVTVSGGIISLNGSPMGLSSNVILVLKSDIGRIYQENSDQGWWYWDPTQTDPWVFSSDPRVVTPPSGGPTPPAAAAAAGYIIRTFGPAPTIGVNWFVRDGTNIQNADGSLTTFGTDGFNAQIQTATPLGGGNWTGTAFGGGAYFEATLKWVGQATQSGGGWPAFWSLDIEMQADPWGPATHWPGQAAGYNIWFEPDFMEAFNPGGFGTAWHNWYSATGGPDVQAFQQAFTFPAGYNSAQYHKIGFLWVPATPSTQGYCAAFVDGVEWQRVRYNFISGTVPAPPTLINGVVSTGGFMDTRHLYMILGSGPNNPMTVSSVEVWQKSAAGNQTR